MTLPPALFEAMAAHDASFSSSIDKVLSSAYTPGSNPQPHTWHWIVRLSSGDYAYVEAGCDNTGWEIGKSYCVAFEAGTLQQVYVYAPPRAAALLHANTR